MQAEPTSIDPTLLSMERTLCGIVTATAWGPSILDRLVDAQLFSDPTHQILWATMLDMRKRKLTLTRDVLVQHLQMKRQLLAVGGANYVHQLPATVGYDVAEAYTEQLLVYGSLRLTHQTANKLLAVQRPELASHVLLEAQETISKALQKLIVAPSTTYQGAVAQSLAMMAHARKQKGGMVGYDCGLRALNNLLGGLKGGKLIIVAARPGIGKSVLLAHFARSVAQDARVVESGKLVYIASLEMSAQEYTDRDISQATHLPSDQLGRGWLPSDVSEDDFNAAIEAAMSDVGIVFDDSLTELDHICSKARRLHAESGLAMIGIDYLQLMKTTAENRTQQIGRITRTLKALSKELDVPVVALAQVGRDVVKGVGRKDKRATPEDLKESGDIEQDADIIMLLYRPEFYGDIDPHSGRPITGVMEVNVAKHRGGAKEKIVCKCDMRCYMVWDEYCRPYDEVLQRPLPRIPLSVQQGSLFVTTHEDIPGNPESFGPRTISEANLQHPN